MAANPLSIRENIPTITIDDNGNVSSPVVIDNPGQVTINVSKYKSGSNECRITISAKVITWNHHLTQGGNTIKVGGGS